MSLKQPYGLSKLIKIFDILLCHDLNLGITYPRELICLNNNDCEGAKIPGVVCRWFNNNTSIKKPTLFDPKLRTYGKVEHPSHVLYTPWRAPGAAPVASPCGVSGGIFSRQF